MSFTLGIRNLMISDSTLTGLISTYEGSPAIFSGYPVPAGAELPYILISQILGNESYNTKGVKGREHIRDIAIFAKETGSLVEIDAIAERVRTLFDRTYSLSITGFEVVSCEVSGPIEGPLEDEIYMYVITLNIKAMEA